MPGNNISISFTSPVSENKGRIFFAELSQRILPLCPVLVGGKGFNQRENVVENKNIQVIKTLVDLDKFLNNLVRLT